MIRKNLWAAAPAFLFSAFAVASALCLPKIVQIIIDEIRCGFSPPALSRGIALFVASAFLSVAFKFGALGGFASFAKKMGETLRLDLIRKILVDPDCGQDKKNFTVLTHDIRSVSDFIESGFPRISGAIWLYGLGICFIAGLNWKFMLPALAGVVLSLVIAVRWHERLENWYYLEREEYARYQHSITGWFHEWELIKGQAREDEVSEDFEDKSRNHLQVLLKANISSAGLVPVIASLWGLVALAFITIGAREFRAGNLTVGGLAAAFQYLVFFSMPTLDLCYGGDLWRKARVAWRHIASVSDSPFRLSGGGGGGIACYAPTKTGTIDVIYPNGVQAEQLRKECPEQGGVFLPRRSHFFSRPLIENFRLADPCPSWGDIEESLGAACLLSSEESAGSWLERDPNTFSSGEKKRAALARIFLRKDATLWIMDDPTAGLNPELVEKLLAELARCREGRVMIIFSEDSRVHEWAQKENNSYA
ncbi:MAG: ABC transporter ATP-binding protein [Candidatus Omnitrophica bacterium]|nr:ABC transporter ATP-binding protein [Candidatus Omnitrophota bacterium]